MKDETVRQLVRRMADDELPMPSWQRVTLRATFDGEIASRRTPFNRLPKVEFAVYAGLGITLAALAVWGMFTLM